MHFSIFLKIMYPKQTAYVWICFESGRHRVINFFFINFSKFKEEQFPLHRANKNFDVSLSSEYLFRELTSLVPVPLDSDDEETSPFHESIVHTCTIAHRDEERLLSAPKGT